jgi:hypothetical protein
VHDAVLWWRGPSYLCLDSSCWPVLDKTTSLTTTFPETRKLTSNDNKELIEFERFSSLTKLNRTMAYVLRFINNITKTLAKLTGPLSSTELEKSFYILTKQAQSESFSSEIKVLKNKGDLPSKSSILSLTPFLDEFSILRVGGRLQQSSISFNQKHPAILLYKHWFTKLIFLHEHINLLHCGPQLLLYTIRDRFWPTRGRVLARSTVNNCIRCRRFTAKPINSIMGNLPVERVTPTYPFQVCGTDFAGPFYITDRKGRGCKISKCYLCLFVCFSTKAVHLEVASNLTTDVFLMCLKRFVSRRGRPNQVFCDNGNNFIGANNEIANFIQSNSNSIVQNAANDNIKFVFSPAYAPNFGGLWEAGVKSAKYHIKRILGNTHLTFEELSTLFAHVESILNSRPLTPLTSDPNDLQPLTPGHFLIGRTFTSVPSPDLREIRTTRLDRFQRIEYARQHFWDRWRNEYMKELQQRGKWRTKQRQLNIGDLVVINDPHLPPLRWHLGRIHRLYPGPDAITRVADVNTANGIVRRSINKLSPLLSEESSKILEDCVPASSPGRMLAP